MCKQSVSKHRDRSTKGISLPFGVCFLYLGVTDRSKLALCENKNVICQLWTLSKKDYKEVTSIIVLGVTDQNIGALAQQEKPTALIPISCSSSLQYTKFQNANFEYFISKFPII